MMDINRFKSTKLRKKELFNKFENLVQESGYSLEKKENGEEPPFESYSLIGRDGEEYTIHVYLKNISNSGWSDKPEIKRIQIPQLPFIERQYKRDFYMLIGLCTYENTDIMAVWNPQNYSTHNTVCSCYVFFSSLNKAFDNGFFYGKNKGKEVLTCTSEGFDDLIKEISSSYR